MTPPYIHAHAEVFELAAGGGPSLVTQVHPSFATTHTAPTPPLYHNPHMLQSQQTNKQTNAGDAHPRLVPGGRGTQADRAAPAHAGLRPGGSGRRGAQHQRLRRRARLGPPAAAPDVVPRLPSLGHLPVPARAPQEGASRRSGSNLAHTAPHQSNHHCPSHTLTHTTTPPFPLHQQSFTTPLREVLVDEVQSRYLEAFLLNCDAKFPPAAIGNIYLWKKVQCMRSDRLTQQTNKQTDQDTDGRIQTIPNLHLPDLPADPQGPPPPRHAPGPRAAGRRARRRGHQPVPLGCPRHVRSLHSPAAAAPGLGLGPHPAGGRDAKKW